MNASKLISWSESKLAFLAMISKGGAAEDIGRLTQGEFYFSTDGFNRPVKIRTPLCLSWHPPNPPTADEILRKARSKRA